MQAYFAGTDGREFEGPVGTDRRAARDFFPGIALFDLDGELQRFGPFNFGNPDAADLLFLFEIHGQPTFTGGEVGGPAGLDIAVEGVGSGITRLIERARSRGGFALAQRPGRGGKRIVGWTLAQPIHDILGARFRRDPERFQLSSSQNRLDNRLSRGMQSEIYIPLLRPRGKEVEFAARSRFGGQQHFLNARHAGTAPVVVRQPVMAGAEECREARLWSSVVGHLINGPLLRLLGPSKGGHIDNIGHPRVVLFA